MCRQFLIPSLSKPSLSVLRVYGMSIDIAPLLAPGTGVMNVSLFRLLRRRFQVLSTEHARMRRWIPVQEATELGIHRRNIARSSLFAVRLGTTRLEKSSR